MSRPSIVLLILIGAVLWEFILADRRRRIDLDARRAETAGALSQLKRRLKDGSIETGEVHYDGWGRPLEVASVPANSIPGRQIVTIRSYGPDGVRQEQGGDDLVVSFFDPPMHETSQFEAADSWRSLPEDEPLFQMHYSFEDGRINPNGDDRVSEDGPMSLKSPR